MANLLLYIRDHRHQFTSAEQKVADYILHYPQQVLQMSSKDLGQACGASSSAVVRLAKSLHCAGFTDLKLQLSNQLGKEDALELTDINPGESIADIKHKLTLNLAHFLSQSESLINEEEIQDLVSKIQSASIIFVYGVGASHIVGKDIQQKFTRLGKHVVCSMDQHEMVAMMSLQQGASILIGVSASGTTLEVCHLMRLAKELGFITVSITEDSLNPLAELADFKLKTVKTDQVLLRSGSTLSLINHLYLVGLIYYSYLTLNYEENIDLLMTTKEGTDQLKEIYRQ